MQVADVHDVKIYNLSVGKSLPEWLSKRKLRALLKKDVDIRRRIELIQDFDMPDLSTSIRVSKDGQYVMATGTYKPRVKCFDVNNLSLKFERCFDSEVVTFEVLSEDYSKMVFLQCDRYVEFHAAHGRLHRLRIPKYGRDMVYHYPSCDLFIVGTSPDVYRINLERGQFMPPFSSEKASIINKCDRNKFHNLLMCGTQEGRVEAWDPRSKRMIASLDCAFSCVTENNRLEKFPSVSALKCDDPLTMAVGTASGQILLYDIRSDKPFCIKDHMYGQPIKDVEFHFQQDLIFSMDRTVLKIWNKNDGKLYTAIEGSSEFNNLCPVPKTGLFFIANENPKIQTYYIPSLGPAPRWASFLDSLTEELEESATETVYDDYKFVTKAELDNLGLEHLVGTNLLRAYMHGYFMDIRLYKKAKALANPFEFQDYRKKKIRETIEKDRVNRVQVNKLPLVNKDLAQKLMNDEANPKKMSKTGGLLRDDRFKVLFENPEFEIDKNSEEYRLLNPVLSKLEQTQKKKIKKTIVENVEAVEVEGKNSSDEESSEAEESSDDEHQWTQEMKKTHKSIVKERKVIERKEELEKGTSKLLELRQGESFQGMGSFKRQANQVSLGDRVTGETANVRVLNSIGSRELTFSTRKQRNVQIDLKNKRHREERRQLMRPLARIFKNKRK